MRFVFLLFLLGLSSCSKLFFPYEEEVLCRRGAGYGFCGGVSDVYKESVERPYRFGLEEKK